MKKLGRITAGLVATAATGATALAAVPADASAAPAAAKLGTRSIATVLAADGDKLDKNWGDFDITEKAVLAVLEAKPNSPVKLLTQGARKATVFVPTDFAFRRLVGDLAGKKPGSEYTTFKAVAGLGIDTVEAVLLYHVVPGATLPSGKVVAANGTKVTTAAGASFTVRVNHEGVVSIVDRDRNDRDARAIPALLDINRGNRQVAHGITQVLRPVNL